MNTQQADCNLVAYLVKEKVANLLIRLTRSSHWWVLPYSHDAHRLTAAGRAYLQQNYQHLLPTPSRYDDDL